MSDDRALCARGNGVDVLVGAAVLVTCVGLGLWAIRPVEPSGNANWDRYRASFKWKGRIMIVFGVVMFLATVLVQFDLVGPD